MAEDQEEEDNMDVNSAMCDWKDRVKTEEDVRGWYYKWFSKFPGYIVEGMIKSTIHRFHNEKKPEKDLSKHKFTGLDDDK